MHGLSKNLTQSCSSWSSRAVRQEGGGRYKADTRAFLGTATVRLTTFVGHGRPWSGLDAGGLPVSLGGLGANHASLDGSIPSSPITRFAELCAGADARSGLGYTAKCRVHRKGQINGVTHMQDAKRHTSRLMPHCTAGGAGKSQCVRCSVAAGGDPDRSRMRASRKWSATVTNASWALLLARAPSIRIAGITSCRHTNAR